MKNIKLKTGILSAALLAGLAGCNGHSGPSAAEIFVDSLNYEDYYDTYYLAKKNTYQPGYIVVDSPEGYRAINIQDGHRWDHYDDLDYFWADSIAVTYIGAGEYMDYWGNVYETKSVVNKDLEKVGAMIEKARIKNVGEQLSAQFGLSEERGMDLGRVLVNYKNLRKCLFDFDLI